MENSNFGRARSSGQRSNGFRQGGSPEGASRGGFSGGQRSDRPQGGFGGGQRQGGFGQRSERPQGGFGGGSRGGFGGGNRGGFGGNRQRSNRRPDEQIAFGRYINKIDKAETVAEFIPKNKFADFEIHEQLKSNIISKGYENPTPIQDSAIPQVLRGVDIVGLANTGTGKTAAFLIPLIDKVLKNPRENILVVVPTRELALQIENELKGFTRATPIYSVCCVGGMNIHGQIARLRNQNNFVIGTPGRLKDLIDRRRIDLSTFNTIVLDEVDQMLDMGFVHDMRYLMDQMPAEKQTLFFSATLSPSIERIIGDFLKNPIRISVKTSDTSKSVDQDIVKLQRGENKIEVLHDLLAKAEFNKVLIFGRTKYGVEDLSNALRAKGFKSESIHGDKNNSGRQRALKSFKDGVSDILVATDVAARGLDIPNVSHVINYDLPATYDDYTHRIGRTGRAGKLGKALTFVM